MAKPVHRSPVPAPRQPAWKFILPVLAASAAALALRYLSFPIALLAFSLLFYAVLGPLSRKQLFSAGFIFGAAASLLLNVWMITVVTAYVKGSFLTGFICFISSALVLGLCFGLQLWLYGALRLRQGARFYMLHNAVVLASLWVLFEWGRGYAFSALPWLSFSAGITQAQSLYLIQPAALGGVHLLSFILIISCCFIAYASSIRRWKLLLLPAGIIILHYASGFFLFSAATKRTDAAQGKSFTAALVIPALQPGTVWNASTANNLVDGLLQLNEKAALTGADIAVWTETVVPWTFQPSDDFLQLIRAKATSAGIFTLIGMNTAADTTGQLLCNSVYLLDTAGSYSRYDKQDLLTLVEKPLLNNNGNIILPFLAASGMKMQPGANAKPITTPWGRAGVLVCNESTSQLAAHMSGSGAQYLVNMGNDGWFTGGFIPRQHFYNCRLRAVENRKDIIVNNNMGAAGLIKASGAIAAEFNAAQSGVQVVQVTPNNIQTNNSFFIYLPGALLLLAILNFFTQLTQTNKQYT